MDPQPLQIRLLGRFGVRRDGTEVPPGTFGGRLPRTLVRLLLTRRGVLVPRDVLVEALWPERPPADPAGNLKILVSRARHALGDPSLITAGPGGYSFAHDDRCQVDAEVFLARVEAGRQHVAAGRHRDSLEAFLSALAEWGGEPLVEDAYADWAQEYRRELSRAHQEAMEGGAAAALALGDAAGAAALAARAAALEPLREAAHLLLVEALAASGDAAAALSTFESFRRRLVEELGVDPSPEAQDLHLRVLRGEIVPATRSVTATVAPAPAAETPFAGREVELAQVLGALAEGGVVVVSGHAGAGKSRLLAEAEARGPVPVLSTRAFRPERDHPWGLARSLLGEALLRDVEVARALSDLETGALAAIVPELGEIREVPEVPGDSESRRALSMQGAVKVFAAASAPALAVMADDIQWADATSLGLLHLVADRVPGLRLVVAYRPEEVDADGPVEPFLAGLAGRGGVMTIDLGPLSPKAVEELLEDPELASLLAEETDRMPLSLKEVLQSLAAHGLVEPAERGPWRAHASLDRQLVTRIARTGQQRAIKLRVDSLPRPRKEVLTLVSLLGREAPPRVLARAAAMAERLILGALDGLARAHLVRLGEQGWAVAHDVVGETIVAGLSREEKGPLHARLASALKEQGEVDPAELAAHLLGAGDAQGAAAAYAEAARRRLDRFANQEALRLADQGLGLRPAQAARRALFEARSEARRRRGNLAGAREDLRSLLAETRSGPHRSVILSRMAMLTSGAQDYAGAADLAEMAIAEAGEQPESLAEALFVGGIVDVNLGDFERAERRFAEALSLYERLGDLQGTAGVVDARAMGSVLGGRLREALPALDRAARLFLDSGNLVRAASPMTVHGAVLAYTGRPEEGLPRVEEALRLARTLGQLEDESYALICRAQVLSLLGRHAEAIAEAERALEIAESLGHREWTCHALWVLGGAWKDAGDLERSEPPLRRALELAGNMPVHASWAAARLAQVLIARGDLEGAEPLVARALAEALPGNLPEAHLARAELAAARGAADAAAIAREGLAVAERVGYAAVVSRLRQLTQR